MSESKTRRLLRRLKLDRVDLVPDGANPEAHITLFKASDYGDDAYLEIAKRTFTQEERRNARFSVDGSFPMNNCQDVSNARQSLGRTSQAMRPRVEATIRRAAAAMNCDISGSVVERAKVPSDGGPTISTVSETAELSAEERIAAAEERAQHAEAVAKELEAQVKKDGVDLAGEALRKELKEQEEELVELRKKERMRAYIEKATDFSKVADPERLAVLLEESDRVLSEDNIDFLGKLLKAAKSASEVEETSKLFSQLSSVETETEDWDVTLAKRAKEVADSQNITIEQAKAKVINEDPELRAGYQKAKEAK